MKAQLKRNEMLIAAGEEFIKHGYAATSLSSVAGRLDLTKGALAHHFPTKDALLTGLGEALDTALDDADAVSRNAYPDSGIRAAIAFLVQLGDYAAKNVQVAATLLLLTDRGTPPDIFAELTVKWLDRVATFIEQGIELGEISTSIEPGDASEFLLASNTVANQLPESTPILQRRKKRLRFIRLGIQALSVGDSDGIVDEVLRSNHIDAPAID